MDKATKSFTASLEKVADETQKDLLNLSNLGKDKLDVLKKRKLVAPTSITSLKVEKTDTFSMDAKKAVGAITKEMLDKATWNDTSFKAVNLSNVKGTDPCGGHLHPLSKVKTEIRTALTLMGFAEMKTNQWVESSFWNFDSLFHP